MSFSLLSHLWLSSSTTERKPPILSILSSSADPPPSSYSPLFVQNHSRHGSVISTISHNYSCSYTTTTTKNNLFSPSMSTRNDALLGVRVSSSHPSSSSSSSDGGSHDLLAHEIDSESDEQYDEDTDDHHHHHHVVVNGSRDGENRIPAPTPRPRPRPKLGLSCLPERWDVLGLGQAMVDFSGMVDDDFLKRLGLEKGTRKVINHEERGRVLRAMDGCSYKAAAGGSLSNSLVALARLGGQPIGGPALSVALAGSIGSDPLGGFYRSKLHRANVNFLSAPVKDGTTGTVIVLTTPDAQRTMLAYQGTSSMVDYDPCLASGICKTSILVVEGYLLELFNTIKTITKACEDARRSGALVAVTASDFSCIERHYDEFWEIIGNYADIIFANSDEARALCDFSSKESPVSATRYLSHFVPLVSVTDGARGSYIGVKGDPPVYIPPSPCAPVDTCGAGDAYASGILYGILKGVSDLKGMGTLAARVAATVVGQQGTRLTSQDAIGLAESFVFHRDSSSFHSDVGSDQISSF